MMANTHRLVGGFLYNQLSPAHQELINRRRFIYGNMKPDLNQKYLKMSHYYRDNEKIIFEMLDELLKSKATISEFSENLGILIHFFCDYTCIYHANDYLYKNHSIGKHLHYELKLHQYAEKKFPTLNVVKIVPFQSVDEIREYVFNLTNRLNQVPLTRSVSEDFEDMVTLSVSVVNYIINQYKFDKLLITHNKKGN